ncbi:PREDICTED: high choriolytic enzyme 2-like, partial [Wasmannia auropunctata]|uniref:high choriolytic enzyme 2-like n=1 Tax=Wasmannia auropunctata TaxID=64793 RepID=UPI0005F00190
MQGGRQQLNLQSNGCAHNKGTPIHELLHAVGFWHEQTREERDSFVNINWNNIPQKNQHNFVKAKPGQTKSYGIPYDYGSVMHYSAYAFAINPKEKTIITKVRKHYFYKRLIYRKTVDGSFVRVAKFLDGGTFELLIHRFEIEN